MKKLALLLLMTAAFMPNLVTAQEFIKRVNGIDQQNSIIYTNFRWNSIIYNNHPDYKLFTMVNETGSAFPYLRFPKTMTVKDFKIHNDTLFFCGAMYNDIPGDSVGIFGYFPLTSFPTCPVKYHIITQAFSLNKIAIGNIYSFEYVHCAMVGRAYNGNGIMVDAFNGPLCSWSIYYGEIMDFTCRMDDIVKTFDNFVISGVNQRENTSFVMFFSTAVIPTQAFFHNGNPIIETLHTYSHKPILLHALRNDTVIAAYIERDTLHMSGFANLNYFGSREMAVNESTQLLAITGRISSPNFQLLLKNSSGQLPLSEIWEMSTTKLISGFAANAHVYQGINSSDYLSDIDFSNIYSSGLFIAGQYTDELMYGMLTPSKFGQCYNHIDKPLILPGFRSIQLNKTCRDYRLPWIPVNLETTSGELTVTVKCNN